MTYWTTRTGSWDIVYYGRSRIYLGHMDRFIEAQGQIWDTWTGLLKLKVKFGTHGQVY